MSDLSAAVLQLAQEDLFTFMGLVHRTDDPNDTFGGQAVPYAHHQQMIDMLTGTEEHVLIMMPRGSGKTTLVQGYVEWLLGRASLGEKDWANRIRILYVSAAAAQAYRVSNAIRATVEGSDFYHAIFPKVKPHRDKWGQEEWKLQGNTIKDANFVASGMDGSILGTRADTIILDDICGEKNTGTPYQLEQVWYTLDNTIKPILVPWGRFIMPCTRWAWSDGAAWAQREGWRELLIKAIGDDERGERSYWPERYTLAFLQAERQKEPAAFARQYQNEVVPDEGLVFERAWFEPRFDYLPAEERWRICSWDTAAGEGRKRSYSAGWSAIVTADFHIYLFRLTRGQVPYTYLKEGIRRQADEDRANFVIIEKKSSGHQAIQEFQLEGTPWRVVEWQPFGQKGSPSRAEANEKIADVCRQGRVHLPSEYFMRRLGADWLPEAEKELFSYPSSDHDDIVDALCQLLFWVEQERLSYENRLRTVPGPRFWPRLVGGRHEKVRL